jgi:hypothetical protein
MSHRFEERRRSPRVELATRVPLRMTRRIVIRLVDVSASGVLVSAGAGLADGAVGRLRLALGAQPFEALVQVRRAQEGADGHTLMGAAILSAEPGSTAVLERFLARAGES